MHFIMWRESILKTIYYYIVSFSGDFSLTNICCMISVVAIQSSQSVVLMYCIVAVFSITCHFYIYFLKNFFLAVLGLIGVFIVLLCSCEYFYINWMSDFAHFFFFIVWLFKWNRLLCLCGRINISGTCFNDFCEFLTFCYLFVLFVFVPLYCVWFVKDGS